MTSSWIGFQTLDSSSPTPIPCIIPLKSTIWNGFFSKTRTETSISIIRIILLLILITTRRTKWSLECSSVKQKERQFSKLLACDRKCIRTFTSPRTQQLQSKRKLESRESPELPRRIFGTECTWSSSAKPKKII